MAAGNSRGLLTTVFTLALALSAPNAVHAQFNRSNPKSSTSDAAKKVFTMEPLSAGLCSSQPDPTITIYADGHQDFNASVRSTGTKDTWQAFVRYYGATGAYLYEV